MKMKGESEKACIKLNVQKKIMAPSPIISWKIDQGWVGEQMESWTIRD